MNRRYLVYNAVLISMIVLGNVTLFMFAMIPDRLGNMKTWHETHCDVDKLNNGNYIASGFPLAGLPILNSINQDLKANRIYEITTEGEVVWQYDSLYFPHETDQIKSGHSGKDAFLVANSAQGGVDQITYPDKDLEWQWLPEIINWTVVNNTWDSEADINNPLDAFGFYVVNDVDFINGSDWGRSYDSLLISIKNFNLVVMVNYTAEMNELLSGDLYGNATNIYWYYGGPGQSTEIKGQHNPDLLPNDNIIIADSDNNRIVEINRSTKEIEWQLNEAGGKEFSWVKDANYNESSDTFVVTDSCNNRIIEVDRSGNIIWEFQHKDMIVPHEADVLPNGNGLVAGGASGAIIEFDPQTGQLIHLVQMNSLFAGNEPHLNYLILMPTFTCSMLGLLILPKIISGLVKIRKLKQEAENKTKNQRREILIDGGGFFVILLILIAFAIFSKPITYSLSTALMGIFLGNFSIFSLFT